MADRTQGNVRFGWGPSALASPEEKERYRAAQIQRDINAGVATVADLPEAYGGRPTGTTRRAIRMQQAWDAQQTARLQQEQALREQERAIQQAEMERRRFDLSERNQILQERQEYRLQEAEAKAQEEALSISNDADRAMIEISGGGVDATGKSIVGLDPSSPDYMQRRNEIIKRYPKAIRDDAFKTAISITDKSYFDRLNFDQQLQAQEESSGKILERQVAAEERAAERQAGIREEERAAQEERGIVSQEREIDKSIREQRQVLAGLQGQKETPSLQKSKAEAQNKLLDLRIEKAALRGLVFETEEEAEAANPPSGSTIYIDRKPFKVP